MTKNSASMLVAAALLLLAAPRGAAETAKTGKPPAATPDPAVARGRYLVRIGGCNDCHTPGFSSAGGKLPEKDWLTGGTIGWRGPWGTTYAANLRRVVQEDAEDAWVKEAAAAEFRPPMPWPSLHAMTKEDLHAVYRFIRSLGPAGEEPPDFVPPDKEPATRYVSMVPQDPKGK